VRGAAWNTGYSLLDQTGLPGLELSILKFTVSQTCGFERIHENSECLSQNRPYHTTQQTARSASYNRKHPTHVDRFHTQTRLAQIRCAATGDGMYEVQEIFQRRRTETGREENFWEANVLEELSARLGSVTAYLAKSSLSDSLCAAMLRLPCQSRTSPPLYL
jgi:hypothetical protein